MKLPLKLLLVIAFVNMFAIKSFSQLQDSVSYYLNGVEEWFYQQPDILSFRYTNKSAFTGSFSPSIVDRVEWFGPGDGVNNIYFNSFATLLDKQQVYNWIAADQQFEKFFVVPVRADKVNEPHSENFWMGTDMSLSIVFDDPNISYSDVQTFAANYEVDIAFAPNQSIQGGIYILHIPKTHTVVDYFSPSASLEICVKMWENDSSIIKTLLPSLRMFHPHIPNDPLVGSQWWMRDNVPYSCLDTAILGTANIDLECAWNFNHEITDGPSYSGEGIVVGVIDFHGIEISHPDMNGQFLPGWHAFGGPTSAFPMNQNLAPVGPQNTKAHLQAVSGIIAAKADNGTGSAGVAYGSNIVPGLMYGTSAQIDALLMKMLALDGPSQVDVINMSFGTVSLTPVQAYTTPMYQGIQACYQQGRPDSLGQNPRGIVLVASMGNNNLANYAPFPAHYDKVLSVGATNPYDQRKSLTDGFAPSSGAGAWGSNYYTYMDVSAPGVCVTGTDMTDSIFAANNYIGYGVGDYVQFSGTSASAPIVSGIAALVLEKDSMLTADQVYEALRLSCDKVGGYTYSNGSANGKCAELGFGRVNACGALNILDVLNVEEIVKSEFNVNHNTSIYNDLLITLDQSRNVEIQIFSITGQQIMFESFEGLNNFNINFRSQASGIYVMNIIDKNTNETYTAKLVKQ